MAEVASENAPLTLAEALAALGSDNQRFFVREYLVDLNATRAAIRAGYSEKTARQAGSELLSNPNVQVAIQLAMQERAERTGITAERVLKEVALLSFSRMNKFAKWGPTGVAPIDSDTLSDEDTACVSEVSETKTKEGGSIKFKLHDKNSALDKLGRHLGLWDKDGTPLNPAQGDEPRVPAMTREQAAKLLAERLKPPQPKGEADEKK